MQYISTDEAWQEFQDTYFSGDYEATEGFATNENPLINSGHFVVSTHTEEELNTLTDYLKTLDCVREINTSYPIIKNDSFL